MSGNGTILLVTTHGSPRDWACVVNGGRDLNVTLYRQHIY